MSEVIMFNKNDLAYFVLPAGDRHNIEKMKEQGFVYNPKLVAVFHPTHNDHKMIMIQDVKLWEEKGYFAEPTMIYHPKEHAPKMVSSSDAAKAIQNGWYLSPAQFPGNEEGQGLKTTGTLRLKEAV
jgi:hypothetical protein